jgi:hypothetical protein
MECHVKATRSKVLLSITGAGLVMALGYFLNRVLDWDQLVAFLPTAWLTKVISSDLFGTDTYPFAVQLGFFLFHLGFWGSVVYIGLSLRERRSRAAAAATLGER